MKKVNLFTWNVPALMESARSDWPQHTTTLVGRELERYGIQRIQLYELSESRLTHVREIKEVSAGCTILWRGRKSGGSYLAGFGWICH